MNILVFFRARVFMGVFAVVAAAVGAWYWSHYRPAIARLRGREAEVQAMARASNEAVLQQLRLGLDGINTEISRARLEEAALAARVPDTTGASTEAIRMRGRISEAATRHGVVVTFPRMIEPSVEGVVRVDGMVVQAVGRYGDLAAFEADVLQLERLTQIRAVRVQAVPDSALASVPLPAAAPGTREPAVPGGDLPPVPVPIGTAPFMGNQVMRLVWFSLVPARAGAREDAQ